MSQVIETASGTQANGRPKPGTKADLRRQLAEALARAEKAEAVALAKPATATPPPGGHQPEALLSPAQGVMRVWLMTDTDGYRLVLIHLAKDGIGWEMVKWSDGTRYHLFEGNGEELTCDCPGFAAYGMTCCHGQGCKHVRMLRALRKIVDPGI
jgi:hypothetical protein